ncbi:hypothetical protein RRG08_040972 [Elysia crispata]|uniref:Uncharacterized protein n=1 Tax=Elysia crispata TaxID=231223 RepID=A0AAE1E8J3_9GAST|nr:hypothetical protein RRG08_040972 [Elysia crispata]
MAVYSSVILAAISGYVGGPDYRWLIFVTYPSFIHRNGSYVTQVSLCLPVDMELLALFRGGKDWVAASASLGPVSLPDDGRQLSIQLESLWSRLLACSLEGSPPTTQNTEMKTSGPTWREPRHDRCSRQLLYFQF